MIDAFTAGLIHGLLSHKDEQATLDIAMASFKFKHTIEGDSNIMTQDDIDHLLAKESHEIQR